MKFRLSVLIVSIISFIVVILAFIGSGIIVRNHQKGREEEFPQTQYSNSSSYKDENITNY